MEAFGTLVSNVQVALGEVGGVTCLPVPPVHGVYVEGDDDPAEVKWGILVRAEGCVRNAENLGKTLSSEREDNIFRGTRSVFLSRNYVTYSAVGYEQVKQMRSR